MQEEAVVNPVPRKSQYQSEVISHVTGIMTRDPAMGPIVQDRLLWEKGVSTMGYFLSPKSWYLRFRTKKTPLLQLA